MRNHRNQSASNSTPKMNAGKVKPSPTPVKSKTTVPQSSSRNHMQTNNPQKSRTSSKKSALKEKASVMLSPYLTAPIPNDHSTAFITKLSPSQEESFEMIGKQQLTSQFPTINLHRLPSTSGTSRTFLPALPTPPTSIAQYQLRKKLMKDNFRMIRQLSKLPKSHAKSEAETWQTVQQNHHILKNMIGPDWKMYPRLGKKTSNSKKLKIVFDWDENYVIDSEKDNDDYDYDDDGVEKETQNVTGNKINHEKETPNLAASNQNETPIAVETPCATSASFPSTTDMTVRNFLLNRMMSYTSKNNHLIAAKFNAKAEQKPLLDSNANANPQRIKSFQDSSTRKLSRTPCSGLELQRAASVSGQDKHEITDFEMPLKEIQQWVETQVQNKYKILVKQKQVSTKTKYNELKPRNCKSFNLDPDSHENCPDTGTVYNTMSSSNEKLNKILEMVTKIQAETSAKHDLDFHSRLPASVSLTSTSKSTDYERNNKSTSQTTSNTDFSRGFRFSCESQNQSTDATSTFFKSNIAKPRQDSEPGLEELSHPIKIQNTDNINTNSITCWNAPKSGTGKKKFIDDYSFRRSLRLSELAANKFVEISLRSTTVSTNKITYPEPSTVILEQPKENLDDLGDNGNRSSGSEASISTVSVSKSNESKSRSYGSGSWGSMSSTDTQTWSTSLNSTSTGFNASITVSDAETVTDHRHSSSIGNDTKDPLTSVDLVLDTIPSSKSDSLYWSTENLLTWSLTSEHYRNFHAFGNDDEYYGPTGTSSDGQEPIEVNDYNDKQKVVGSKSSESIRLSEPKLKSISISSIASSCDARKEKNVGESCSAPFCRTISESDFGSESTSAVRSISHHHFDFDVDSSLQKIGEVSSIKVDIQSDTHVTPKCSKSDYLASCLPADLDFLGEFNKDDYINVQENPSTGIGSGTDTPPKLELQKQKNNHEYLNPDKSELASASPRSCHIFKVQVEDTGTTPIIPVSPSAQDLPISIPHSDTELNKCSKLSCQNLCPDIKSSKSETSAVVNTDASLDSSSDYSVVETDRDIEFLNLPSVVQMPFRGNMTIQNEDMEMIPLKRITTILDDASSAELDIIGNQGIEVGMSLKPRKGEKEEEFREGDQQHQHQHQQSASANWTESVRPRKRRQKCQRRVSFSNPVALYRMLPIPETPADSILDVRLELDRVVRARKLVFRYPQSRKQKVRGRCQDQSQDPCPCPAVD